MNTGILTRRRPKGNADENPYWISFSDIMAGLLVIFILASVHLVLELMEQKEQIEKDIDWIKRVHELRADMLEEIKKELAKQDIEVNVSDNKSVIHIPDDLAFRTLSWEIPEEKEAFVKQVGLAVYHAMNKDNRIHFIDTVFIEGHADSRKTLKIYTDGNSDSAAKLEVDNWGLSTFRAISIWKNWSKIPEIGPELQEMKNREGRAIFSVSGYAATRLLEDPDDTPKKQGRNRRIDLRFTMFAPKAEDFQKFINF